jgi:hypothetical protein
MAIVEPGKGRVPIEHDGTTLRITIPAESRILPLTFLAVWSVIWVAGGIGIVLKLWRGEVDDARSFMLFWSVMWAFGTIWALYSLIWTLAGKEIIELSPTMLRYRQQTPFFSRGKEYTVSNITNLRTTALTYADIYSPRVPPFAHFDRCAVCFDYGPNTHRIAFALRETDAKYVIGEMCGRVKSLCA